LIKSQIDVYHNAQPIKIGYGNSQICLISQINQNSLNIHKKFKTWLTAKLLAHSWKKIIRTEKALEGINSNNPNKRKDCEILLSFQKIDRTMYSVMEMENYQKANLAHMI
jgi:hypothetical protein